MPWSESCVRACRIGVFGPRLDDRLRLWRRTVMAAPLKWGGVIQVRKAQQPGLSAPDMMRVPSIGAALDAQLERQRGTPLRPKCCVLPTVFVKRRMDGTIIGRDDAVQGGWRVWAPSDAEGAETVVDLWCQPVDEEDGA